MNNDEIMLDGKEPVLSVDYSLTNADEDYSYRLYQKKFVYKKCLRNSLLFCIPLIMFIIQIVRNPDYTMGWCLAAVCIGVIVMQWVNQILIRKNLLNALAEIEGDRYRFSLYEDGFEVSTLEFIEDIEQAEEEKEVEEIYEDEEKTPLPPPAEYKFFDFEIEAVENNDYFTVFLIEKKTYYVLPKRFMDNEKIELLREHLQKKLENNYKRENRE